jgi:pimeloyl-ACP methyl ester carboxylesterase
MDPQPAFPTRTRIRTGWADRFNPFGSQNRSIPAGRVDGPTRRTALNPSRLHRLVRVVGALSLLAPSAYPDSNHCEIIAYDGKTIHWQAQSGTYSQVEWASDLLPGASWESGWYRQSAILSTGATHSVDVPRYFRVTQTTNPYLDGSLLLDTWRRQSDVELHRSTNWWNAIKTSEAFRAWHDEALARLSTNRSTLHLPEFGDVSYVRLGAGPVILVSHGGIMGSDSAHMLTNLMDGTYSLLCPSRPGYPGTPLLPGTNDSFELAADMMASLLDALSITTPVFVLGTSAGGPTALQFALRHPSRVKGVLLFAAVSLPNGAVEEHPDNFVAPLLVPDAFQDAKSFKLVDATIRHPEEIMRAWFELVVLTNDVTRAQLAAEYANDPASVDRLLQFTRSITPVRQRYAGTVNDIMIMMDLPAYPLNSITAPVFVAHSLYDGDVHIDHAHHVVEHVAGPVSHFFFYGGGHLYFLGDPWSEITQSAVNFLHAVDAREP